MRTAGGGGRRAIGCCGAIRRAGWRPRRSAIRMLQVSGALNRRMGGPGYHLWEYSGYVIVFKPKTVLGPDEFRRMIYQFKPRLQQDGTFGVFDCPDATTTMPRRNRLDDAAAGAQPAQRSVRARSERALRRPRLRREAGERTSCPDPPGVSAGVRPRAIGNRGERGGKLVTAHGLAVFCRALFNANEFVFVN